MAEARNYRIELEGKIANIFCTHCERKIGEVKASPAELDADPTGRRAKQVEQKISALVEQHVAHCAATPK
jgi:hypothetical protein